MSGGGAVVIGYQYYLGMEFALCQDSATELLAIYTNNGNKVMLAPGNYLDGTSVSINKPELYGGRKKGGGVVGTIRLQFGSPTQTVTAYMKRIVPTDPALPTGAAALGPVPLRGLTTIVAERPYICAMNPSMRPWEFKAYRRPTLLSASPQSEIEVEPSGITAAADGYDVNPAAIVDECFFNTQWGLGLTADDVELADLEAVSTTLKAEGVGLSLRLSDQLSMKKFIREVMTHINGAIYISPATGKIRMSLMRDTDTSTLSLDSTNIISFDSFERVAWSSTINEMVVEYTSKVNYDKASLTIHSASNLDIQGDIVSRTVAYRGVRSQALAARFGARDLSLLSFPLSRVELTINKQGWDLVIGGVVEVTWDDYELNSTRFRIVNVDYGDVMNNRVKLMLLQDAFQDFSASQSPYGFSTGAVVTTWTPISAVAALASTQYDAIPIPYYTLYNVQSTADFNVYDLALDNFFILSEKPSADTLGVLLDDNAGEISTTFPAAKTYSVNVDSFIGDLVTGADLVINLTSFDGYLLTADELTSIGLSTTVTLVIGNELFLVSNFVEVGSFTGVYAATCKRGAYDTAPEYHIGTGADLIAYLLTSMNDSSRLYGGLNGITISDGNTANYHLETQTFNDLLPYASAPAIALVGNSRADRPNPPKALTLSYNASNMTITWKYDDKVTAIGTPSTENSYTNSPESTDIRTQVYVRAYDGTVLLNATYDSTITSTTLSKVTEKGLTIDGLVSPSVFVEVWCFYFTGGAESYQRVKQQSFRSNLYFDGFETQIPVGNASLYTNTDNTIAKQYRYVCDDKSVVLITGTASAATIYVCNENGGITSTISGGNCLTMLAGGTPKYIDIRGATSATASIVWTENGTTFNVAVLATVDVTIDDTFTITDIDFNSANQVLMDNSYIYITDPTQTYPAATATGAIHRTGINGAAQTKIQPNLVTTYTLVAGGTSQFATRIDKTGTNAYITVWSSYLRKSTPTTSNTATDWIESLAASTTTLTDLDFNLTGVITVTIQDVIGGDATSGFVVHVEAVGVEYLLYFASATASSAWEYTLTSSMLPATITNGIDNQVSKVIVQGLYVYFVYSNNFPTSITTQTHRPYYQPINLYPDDVSLADDLASSRNSNNGMHYFGSMQRITISTGLVSSAGWSHDHPYFVIGANENEVVGGFYAPDHIQRILNINNAGTKVLASTEYSEFLYWIATP